MKQKQKQKQKRPRCKNIYAHTYSGEQKCIFYKICNE